MYRRRLYVVSLTVSFVSFGLAMIDNCCTYALVGIIWGILAALWWTWGSVIQAIEFWDGTCPRWIYLIYGRWTGNSIYSSLPGRLERFVVKSIKPVTLFYCLLFTWLFIDVSIEGTYSLAVAITFSITWIVCICMSERYFRRKKYSPVKNWSTIPPK
jgi:hypothetical protein